MRAKADSHSELIDAARREMERGAPYSPDVQPPDGPAPDDLPQTVLQTLARALPGYDIEGPLGRGGQGLVLRGLQKATRRDVAIKVLRAGPLDGPVTRARFEREVHILGQLKHPNIVTILDSGSAAGHEYYIMDYIRGYSLTEYVREAGPGVRAILALFATLCDALCAAHLRGIIHRDLKPANIRVDLAGEPHVLDFGLAKVNPDDVLFGAAGQQTETGVFVGSVAYAAPEQFRGPTPIDLRTDVYAIGVLLYECLTGELPYVVDGALHATIDRILNADAPKPSRSNPEVRRDVDAIVAKCLQKDPEKRYQNAGELMRELRRYLAGEPIEARRDSSWYLLRKTLRRHRVSATIAALGVSLLATFAGAMTVLYQKEAQRSLAAQRQNEQAREKAAVLAAVSSWVTDHLLVNVKPSSGGRAGSLRDALNAAAAKLDRGYGDSPLAEAAIREVVGKAYMELSDWKAALLHAERSLELHRRHAGAAAPETLASLNLVGRIYRRLGRIKEADAIYREMLPPARATLGPDHALTLQGENNHAWVLWTLGHREDAYDLNHRVLEVRLRTIGESDEETLSSLNNEAFYLSSLGRLNDAEPICRRAYETRRKLLGPDHPDTLRSMNNLASLRHRLGRSIEALPLAEECLARVQSELGDVHEDTVNAWMLLAQIYRKLRCPEDAEQAAFEAFRAQVAIVGPVDRMLATILRDLGDLYAEQGRYDEADEMMHRAWDLTRETMGASHAHTYRILSSIGALRRKQGLMREAEALLIEAHRGVAAALGETHPDTQGPARVLIRLYQDEGDALRAAEWQAKFDAADPPPASAPTR